jgi:hypothetical protein
MPHVPSHFANHLQQNQFRNLFLDNQPGAGAISGLFSNRANIRKHPLDTGPRLDRVVHPAIVPYPVERKATQFKRIEIPMD